MTELQAIVVVIAALITLGTLLDIMSHTREQASSLEEIKNLLERMSDNVMYLQARFDAEEAYDAKQKADFGYRDFDDENSN